MGKDLNTIGATGMREFIGWSTVADPVTDSLRYVAAASEDPVSVVGADWKIFVPDGTVIKLVMAGATEATVRCDCTWYPAEKGARLQ